MFKNNKVSLYLLFKKNALLTTWAKVGGGHRQIEQNRHTMTLTNWFLFFCIKSRVNVPNLTNMAVLKGIVGRTCLSIIDFPAIVTDFIDSKAVFFCPTGELGLIFMYTIN